MSYIEEALTECFGEKCLEFDPECHLCKTWAEYEGLKSDITRLSDELQSKGKENHIYREGRLAGFADGFDRGVEAAAIVISKRADLANEAGNTLDYVYGIQGCVDVIRSLKRN